MNSHEFYDGLFLAKMEAGLIEVAPLPKKRRRTEDEILADIQAMPSEKRHLLLLCDLPDNYKKAKNGKGSWSFEYDYLCLKDYMKQHRWDKNFIKSKFGISFGAMTQLYFQCANL